MSIQQEFKFSQRLPRILKTGTLIILFLSLNNFSLDNPLMPYVIIIVNITYYWSAKIPRVVSDYIKMVITYILYSSELIDLEIFL